MGATLIGLGIFLLFNSEKQYLWAFLFFVFGLAMLITPLRLRSSIRRQFRLAGLDQEIAMSVGSGGISIKRVGRDAESHYGWSAIEKHIESLQLITLLPNKVQFIPIPKRVLSPEHLQELRSLVAEHIRQQPSQRSAAVS